MAFKGFFKGIGNQITKEINKQIDQVTGGGGSEDSGDPNKLRKIDFTLVEGVIGKLISGNNDGSGENSDGSGSSKGFGGLGGLKQVLNAIQGAGGILPGNISKFLPGILKVAEVIGHGLGDDTPRTEQNEDGTVVDEVIQTVVDGRKIHAGVGSKRVLELSALGDRGSGHRTRGNAEAQDYQKIKAKCLASGKLFEDDQFLADDSIVFFSKSSQRQFYWKRPHEIVENPRFFVEGASRFDVKQGELGDCWLLAAVANLTLNDQIFYQVVPQDNSFVNDYCGVFHFRFWQYGKWVDVVVDDRLPTDYQGNLLFMHSEDKNEFWSALLEKAYAKLHGSYEALKGGTTCEALEDFTGGVTEMYEIQGGPPNLFKIMAKARERCSFMGCSIEPDPHILEAQTREGLIKGHAYSITDVKLVDIQTPRVSGKIPLLRIRNPWGNEAEWKGAWSDGSQEWQFIPDETKEDIGLTFDADGEFWMSQKDFMRYFQRLEICNLSPDSLDEESEETNKKWNMNIFEGSWIRGATAGGCRNYIDTFAFNPQYLIELNESDDDDEDGKCTVIIALMQKNRRAQRKLGVECLTIGFAIYHIKEPGTMPKPLPTKFFKFNASVARSPTFINLREVSCRFKLPIGTYCIVPSTFEPNEEGDFIIRVFSETSSNMKENDSTVGMGEVDDRVKESEPVQDEAAKRVQEFFKTVAGEDLEIDWAELKEVLDIAMKREFEFDGFSKDVCRSMVAMMDVDRSGKLGLDEFIQLWKSIRTWKNVFKMYDADKSGHLSSFELRRALTSAGYQVNNKVLEAMILRYGDKEGQISFDDFIMCAVKLKAMIEIFKERDIDGSNKAEFSLEDWVEKTLYS